MGVFNLTLAMGWGNICIEQSVAFPFVSICSSKFVPPLAIAVAGGFCIIEKK